MAKEQQNENLNDKADISANDADIRRTRLKTLIVLGKERGYLTYAEINDHLPDDVQDSEQIDGIIGMINDMGIQVYEEAPDAEALLMSDAPAPVADKMRQRKRSRRFLRWIPNLDARLTRCVCICVKWARLTC